MSKGTFCYLLCAKGLSIAFATLLLTVLVSSFGCGGGTTNTDGAASPSPTPSPATAAQVKIGDAPADRVVSFEASLGPITLSPAAGAAVTVLSTARRIELTHLSGTNEPLVLLNIPQGTYTSASITVANPEVSFLNSVGTLVKLEPAFNQTITVNFNPALTVGASASIVNIDLNVATSLSFDAQGNVTGVNLAAASFTFSTAAVAAENQQEAEDGELEDTTGMVTNVSGNSFTMAVGQNGVPLTFTTDTNTQFNDGATLATMLNTIVTAEGITKADGTLYAKEVEGIENNNGAELEGLITLVSGNPATQLSVVAHDGVGSGMDDTKVGNPMIIDVTGAQYRVTTGSVDTSGIGGLPAPPAFPFDATTVHAGQRVEVESVSAMTGNSMAAEKVRLQQQALTGTVSGLPAPTSSGPQTLVLTVAPDSAFATLSGQTTINVFWQPGTNLHNVTAVNNGDTVRVRGLVFFTGSAFNMIARRIER